MNEFGFFTTMRSVFVHFLEEIEDSKKAFQNFLTFKYATVACNAGMQCTGVKEPPCS